MSTFRYDTKFRGAATNKGAIKLAPKFVNCPTCGFVRSKDRSKVIAKKSKQYHLFMPPNSGNKGTYYYIAYDGQPEQRFDNSTGFDITCSSIESYAVKFDRFYGSDNFILMIDNGTKPKSINPNTQLVIMEDAGYVFIGGGVPITPENLEVTFEDGDSISFNIYTEEIIIPGKYRIYKPSFDAINSIFIYYDNTYQHFNVNEEIKLYFDKLDRIYTNKITGNLANSDVRFIIQSTDGSGIKSVYSDKDINITKTYLYYSGFGISYTNKYEDVNVIITFDNNESISFVINEEYIDFKYKVEIQSLVSVYLSVATELPESSELAPRNLINVGFDKKLSLDIYDGTLNEFCYIDFTKYGRSIKEIKGFTSDFIPADINNISDRIENNKLYIKRNNTYFVNSKIILDDNSEFILNTFSNTIDTILLFKETVEDCLIVDILNNCYGNTKYSCGIKSNIGDISLIRQNSEDLYLYPLINTNMINPKIHINIIEGLSIEIINDIEYIKINKSFVGIITGTLDYTNGFGNNVSVSININILNN